jgi:hypothetical protein
MHWPKSPLTEITGLALAMAVLLPVSAIGADNHPILMIALAGIGAYAIPTLTAIWVAADLKERRRTPCFELPFLLLIAWPVSLFWYCIWTRGWQGLALALGLVALSYLPTLTMGVTWIALQVVSGAAR